MQVATHLFGTVDVNPDNVIEFPLGLTGFEECRRFQLIHEESAGSPPVTYTLQSLERADVALQIIDPTVLGFEYEMELSDAETATLKIASPTDVAVMVVLFKDEGKLGVSARAPLLINVRERLGMQKLMPLVPPRVTLSNLRELSTAV